MRRAGRCRGLTLVELLIVMVMTAILASALGYAFSAELTVQWLQEARRAETDRTDIMEREITRLLQGARLSAATDQTAYFLGTTDSGVSDLGCDRLTFTTTAPGVPLSVLDDTSDFEAQQEAQGPVGGLAEVSLGMTPVGDAGGRTGLFERMQRPSDADPTQGGFESLLDTQIDRIGFEFWDGLEWTPTWSTLTGKRQLPEAVRINYTVNDAPDSPIRSFVVPIPASNIDADNPVSVGGGS